MADGAFGLSKELAEETAPVWEKVKGLVTPLEWPEQAKLISEINALKKTRDARSGFPTSGPPPGPP